MKTKTFFSSALAAFLIAAGAYTTSAQSLSITNDVPKTISYQGVLADNNGIPLPDGQYTITVALYTDPNGTNKLWQDSYNTQVSGGLFNLYLGDGNTPLPTLPALNTSLWIGTQIGDEPMMFPLTPLSASPYALNVPDRAITTGKLADGSVTAEKVDMPYISGVEINDQKVAGVGTVLKLKSSDDIKLDYDRATNSITIASNRNAEATTSDPEKGGAVLDFVDGWENWKGRVGTSPLVFQTPVGTFNTLAGGASNTIGASNNYSTIVGGTTNSIDATTQAGFIGGGQENKLVNALSPSLLRWATIAGGHENEIHADHGFIGGGHKNKIVSESGTLAGGWENLVSSNYSFIGGGVSNEVSGPYSSIVGGQDHDASDEFSFVGGGYRNKNRAKYAAITGGKENSIVVDADYSFIGDGTLNKVSNSYSSVVGGSQNEIYADYSFIGGGTLNDVDHVHSGIVGGSGNEAHADYSFVGGGTLNSVDKQYSSVVGGFQNEVHAEYSSISGGNKNQINATSSFIGGGGENNATGNYSAIPGGDHLKTTSYGQTAVGFYNAPRGSLTAAPTPLFPPSDPIFMVGNGSPAWGPFSTTYSNAFEVSYNGHSVVYGENGMFNNPYRGATYTDNVIYAWGDINNNGTINSDFGVTSVNRTGVGNYVVTVAFIDPVTNTPLNFAHASITATAVHDDVHPEAPCPIITTSRMKITTSGTNEFTIRIRDTQCRELDAPFMFKVTGRQALNVIIIK